MCLSNSEKITPKEDIVCYKLFRVNHNECDSDMLSPYYTKSWKIGRIESLKRNDPIVYSSGYKKYIIRGGAYHSYQNITDIPAELLFRSGFVVCKCIIPKSSKYVYSGYNNENKKSKGYASQKLKPIEFVHFEKFESYHKLYSSNPSNN